MSQNLTQPEEIDRVLMEMAGHDMETGKPISEGMLSDGRNHDLKCKWSDRVADLSYRIAHKKQIHGLPDP